MKIVITGGPCAGKSTALARLPRDFHEWGYDTLVLPETATELLHAGLHPAKCGGVPFQRTLLHLQLHREAIYQAAADELQPTPIILCDRGIIDGKAYMDADDFQMILSEIHLNEAEILTSYDAVFYMESTARNFPRAYNKANNNTRMESVHEAVQVDDALQSVWKNHPYFVKIPGHATFYEKYELLKKEIFAFLQAKR
jgi:thymidylate kinase